MTSTAIFLVGFLLGWLAAWLLLAAIVVLTRRRQATAPPLTSERLDELHKIVYGHARDDERRTH